MLSIAAFPANTGFAHSTAEASGFERFLPCHILQTSKATRPYAPVPALSPTHSGRKRPSAAFVLPVRAALPRRLPYPVVFLLTTLLPVSVCAHSQWPYGQQSGESKPQNRGRHDIDPACRKSSRKYPASPLRLPEHCLLYVSRSDKPTGQTVDTSPAATGDTVSGIRLLNPELNHPFLFLFSIYKTKASNQRLQKQVEFWELFFPMHDVGLNIMAYILPFLLITNDSIMESGLPGKVGLINPGIFSNCAFDSANNDRQPSL